MDTLTAEARTEIPWELIFADDIALMAGAKEELQWKVIRWQESLRKGDLKMNTRKWEVMVSRRNGRQAVTVRDIDGAEWKQVQDFKHLGSEIDTEGGTAGEISRGSKQHR